MSGFKRMQDSIHSEQEVGRVRSVDYETQSTFTKFFSSDCRALIISNNDADDIKLYFKDINDNVLYSTDIEGLTDDSIPMHNLPFRKVTFETELGHSFIAKGYGLKIG